IIGMFGVFYNYTLLKTQNLYASQKWLPVQFRPIIPFVLAGMLGLFLPEVLGGGHELIVSIINGNNTLRFLFILLLIKFAFSMVSFGSGAPGGIFFPLLVIGGMTGAIYGTILVKLVHFPPQYVNNFMILGMAGYFTAIVRAPITGSILITEMTGSFNHLLSLALVSIIAYIIADLMGSKPIYESLLERLLAKNGHKELSEDNNAKTILEVVVHHGSYLEGKKIKELNMPEKCLLVSIKRGDNEVIPRGNTSIYAGDYLVVLTSEHSEISIRENLLKMAESSYAINNA
ncbi:MAG: ClC family H(+)/Cl(-) exchange transporter, partial [Clostridiaceae bacterium]|nr:ClC family H(+)/Cl(-) exchange transporter [Clostridiaceae bacterium]